jgi:hypothetical protein
MPATFISTGFVAVAVLAFAFAAGFAVLAGGGGAFGVSPVQATRRLEQANRSVSAGAAVLDKRRFLLKATEIFRSKTLHESGV